MQTNFENYLWEQETKTISEQIRDNNYKEIINDNDRLCRTQKLVYNAIPFDNSICDKEISQRTGLPINVVCGRRNELVKMNLVVADPEPVEYPDYNGCMRLVTGWRRLE